MDQKNEQGALMRLSTWQTNLKVNATIEKLIEQKKEVYRPDFEHFLRFCEEEQREPSYDAMEKYLHESIVEQGVKYSTFNCRAAGIQYYLRDVLNLEQTPEQQKRIQLIRQLYNTENYLRLKPMRGVRAEKQEEVKADIRKRAICSVNLITANRSSEMVRLKVSDFDLESRTVLVMLKKQGEMKEKRLTLECVKAVQKYIQSFQLSGDDYFVGAADRWGNYKNRMITERSYNRLIHEWLGFASHHILLCVKPKLHICTEKKQT